MKKNRIKQNKNDKTRLFKYTAVRG